MSSDKTSDDPRIQFEESPHDDELHEEYKKKIGGKFVTGAPLQKSLTHADQVVHPPTIYRENPLPGPASAVVPPPKILRRD